MLPDLQRLWIKAEVGNQSINSDGDFVCFAVCVCLFFHIRLAELGVGLQHVSFFDCL